MNILYYIIEVSNTRGGKKMNKIDETKIVDLLIKFKWESSVGRHEEVQFCKLNIWRDFEFLPEKLRKQIWGRNKGDNFKVSFKAGELFKFSSDNIIQIEKSQFRPPKAFNSVKPHLGRFYPLGFFIGLAGVYPQNIKPARVIEITDKYIKIDTNPPIARYDIEVEGSILDVRRKTTEVGGECRDWCSICLETGPGMQAPYDGVETDFEIDNPESFKREDEADDRLFYSEPRLTNHIDMKAHENLVSLYENLIPNGAIILDLMSSYQSHIPVNKHYEVIGLGLNEEEMRQNRVLSSFVVHDINENPVLPFPDNYFDAVVCDLSIEYVTKPLKVVEEVRRVLKTAGIFTVSFSNRYFPTKVIKLWIDLHEFERMGYVLEIIRKVGGFRDLRTYSFRGFRRPYDDKYFGCTFISDPLYVVYAEKC